MESLDIERLRHRLPRIVQGLYVVQLCYLWVGLPRLAPAKRRILEDKPTNKKPSASVTVPRRAFPERLVEHVIKRVNRVVSHPPFFT